MGNREIHSGCNPVIDLHYNNYCNAAEWDSWSGGIAIPWVVLDYSPF